MKAIRVPWIRCRADEIGAESCDMSWRNRPFHLIAYNEREGREWWGSLSEAERDAALGIEVEDAGQASLF